MVSNHGGRQLDRALPSAWALPDVLAAVAGRAPVLADGGIRSGTDALIALALGADAVMIGRPVLWALAAGGAPAVRALLEELSAHLRRVAAMSREQPPRRSEPDDGGRRPSTATVMPILPTRSPMWCGRHPCHPTVHMYVAVQERAV